MNITKILVAFFKSALYPSETVVRDRYSGQPGPTHEETAAESENRQPGQGQLVPVDLPFPGRFYLWQPACGERDPHPEHEEGMYLVWVIHTARLGALQVAAFATARALHATFFTARETTAEFLRAGLPQLRPVLLELGYSKVLLDVHHHPDIATHRRGEGGYDHYV
ncbi:MAG: hypothetical protein ACUVTQ_01020 [Desulfotomaculales bacterium]